MKKMNILLFTSILFSLSACNIGGNPTTNTNNEPDNVREYSSVISFNLFYDEVNGNYEYFFVDSRKQTLGYLKSDTLPDIGPIFPGDYIEITFTSFYNGVFCEPEFPPNCYIADGELLSKDKVEHKTKSIEYKILDGVGTFKTDGWDYVYNNYEYFLNLEDGCAYPFSDLKDGDILKVAYSELEDTHDEEGKLIHNISCFYI